MRKQIALIPAYDPDEQLVELVRNMKQEGFDVVVVDDGSAADKKEIFQAIVSRILGLISSPS